MTGPAWLSPLSHGVPWAGLPQPPAPPLWAFWCTNDVPCQAGCPMTSARMPHETPEASRAAGWVEVPRVEWSAPQEKGGGK